MRQLFLDTETTGLEHKLGHRVIEIGVVEMLSRQVTQRHFHKYLNPEREIDPEAQNVHGITLEFLQDKPRFAEVAAEFLDFISGAELIIHNAPFDTGFLNAELARLDLPTIESVCPTVTDSLRMAREIFPGKRNNLDALCERLGIKNDHRVLHGALLDSEILAEVYLAMTRGQDSLIMDMLGDFAHPGGAAGNPDSFLNRPGRQALRVIPPNAAELAEHAKTLELIQKESRGNCLWLNNNV